jgi:DNA repair exonuclease SbcCD ATPase subunit
MHSCRNRIRRFAQALLLLPAVLLAASLFAQEGKPETKGSTTPLGIRQERVQRMMEDVERRFNGLIQSLQQTEAERAERLQQALNEAKKLGLLKRMGDISKLLDQTELEGANEGQKKVLADLKELIALLLDDNRDADKFKEFEQLQQWKKELENILAEERGLKRESDKVSDKDKTLADLKAQIKAVEALVEKQKEVIKTTEATRSEGVPRFGPIAGKQEEVRDETEKVADKIAEAAGHPKPGEAKPNDGKPGEGKPGEGKPADGKPGEGKPGEGAPSEGKPGDGQPGEQPPAAPQRQPEPGEKPLHNAAENQKQAAKNLQEGKGKAAQGDEQRALDDLNKALAELKREEKRIASLPPEAFQKMAQKQDQNSEKAAGLEKSMEQAKAGDKKGDGKSGEGKNGGKKPGQERVQQAQKHMEQASGDLRKEDPKDAARQQQKAIKELEQALQEIEERLAQLREETQVEKLARLEARFRAMLARQQKATIDTATIHKRAASGGDDLKRVERNALVGEETALAEEAQVALEIILDDGTSVVFPDIVGNLRDDLGRVAELIGNERIDLLTQALQKEVETTLEELIEALQKAQQQKEGSGGGGGGGGGQEPLLPGSAELKLLRAAQLRINRRTDSLEKAKEAAGKVDETQKQELQTISRRQAEIAEMTVRILERGE